MGRYQAYSEYKDSGVGWMGDVPKDWNVVPCRATVKNIADKNEGAKDQNYLSLMANVGVIRYEDKGDIGNKKPDDLSKCKIVKKGNLVINSMNYAIGSYGMSDYDGVCSPVYIVLDADEDVIEQRFALRVFENGPFQKYLATFGNGILEHRAAIGWDDIKGAYIPLPSKNEQVAILNFLDHETTKIDTLIEKQQQLIKLLKEKRQAVISHAVTKGLNPNAPMKHSGVEWLGEVPEHWEVLQIQRVLSSIEQGASPQASNRAPEADEFGVIKISAVKSGIFDEGQAKTLDDGDFEERFQIHKNDLLVTRGNTPELVADACVVEDEPETHLMMCDLVYRLNVRSIIKQKFLCYWLLSSIGRLQIQNDARGSSMTMAKVSQGHIKSWLTTLPPLKEQKQIVNKIESFEINLKRLLNISEVMIERLKERRTALISAAVTGKIDVRNWEAPEPSDNHNKTVAA